MKERDVDNDEPLFSEEDVRGFLRVQEKKLRQECEHRCAQAKREGERHGMMYGPLFFGLLALAVLAPIVLLFRWLGGVDETDSLWGEDSALWYVFLLGVPILWIKVVDKWKGP
ncbi:MAG: hypothetical protein ACYTEZ_19905 [Planctomycetota bacterium]|jgi:hypothetical protein